MNDFPYTNFHELNQDWIIKQTKENTTDITSIKQRLDNIPPDVESEIATINSEIDALQNEIENISSLYLCTFGVTTNSEIESALNDKKLPICIYNGHIYVISQRVTANRHRFGSVYRTESAALECLLDSWLTQNDTFASTTYVDSAIAAIPPEIFVAVYEQTSYADLLAAYNDGKYIVMKRQDDPDFPDANFAVFAFFESDEFFFYDMNPTTRQFNRYRRNATDWYIQQQGTLALTNSPTFIGTPKAPTAATGTNTTQIATTAFVQNSISEFEIIDTASGVIASFPDGANTIPLIELKAEILPYQAPGTPAPDNILPISGFDTITITRMGENLLSLKNGVYAIGTTGVTATITNGELTLSGTAVSNGGRTTKLTDDFILKAGTYYIATNRTIDEAFYINKSADNSVCNTGDNRNFTLTEDTLVYGGINVTGGTVYSGSPTPMLNVGNTGKPYEKASILTLTIDLSGTRYGGVLDVKTGVLTVTHQLFTFDGSENWTNPVTGTNAVFRLNNTWSVVKATANDYICNMAIKTNVIANLENYGFTDWVFRTTEAANNYDLIVVSPVAQAGMTLAQFKTMLSENNMTINAKIATPITVQLTANPLFNTLPGTNNIWNNTPGETEVTYHANLQKYIEKKLS